MISFQENPDDTFLAIQERIKNAKGRIRKRQSDYLAYSLIDNLVDHYFLILDRIEEQIDELERAISQNPVRAAKQKIHHLKVQLLTLRKIVLPLREAVTRFSRSESPLVQDSTGLFVRDLSDHVLRVSDLIETYRDMLNGLQELYVSEIGLRTNNIMQVLTIITTLFAPLTFIAGIYGMNFDYMPELRWKNGYFYVLGLMFLIFLGSLVYFRRKRWI